MLLPPPPPSTDSPPGHPHAPHAKSISKGAAAGLSRLMAAAGDEPAGGDRASATQLVWVRKPYWLPSAPHSVLLQRALSLHTPTTGALAR